MSLIRTAGRRLAGLALCLCLLLAAAPPATAQEGGEGGGATAAQLALSVSLAGKPAPLLTDGSRSSKLSCDGSPLALQAEGEIAVLYLIWDRPPGEWSAALGAEAGGQTVTGGGGGFLHEAVFLPAAANTLTLTPPAGSRLCEVYAFGPGGLPDWVQVWQPPCEDADLLALSTHADDEHLFFGGILPYYAGQLQRKVQVAYFTNHWAEPYRPHELLDGLWTVGVRNYPVISDFTDYYATSLEGAMTLYPEEETIGMQVALLRRFKPEVVVGHDVNGEYGHGVHMYNAYALQKAVALCVDPAQYPESAAAFGVWQPRKVYLHLWPEGGVVMDWGQPLSRFGGRTALEMAREGYAQHKSQQEYWFSVEDSGPYDCRKFGLYYTSVGPDEEGNDLFEHLNPEDFSDYQPPQPTPAPQASSVAPPPQDAPGGPPQGGGSGGGLGWMLWLALAAAAVAAVLAGLALRRRGGARGQHFAEKRPRGRAAPAQAARPSAERGVPSAGPAPGKAGPSSAAKPARAPGPASGAAPAARRRGALYWLGRGLAVFGVTLAGLLLTLLGAVFILCRGPSPAARALFVTTTMETSALKFVPHLALSHAQVEEILAANAIVDSGQVTEEIEFVETEDTPPLDSIQLVDVSGATFKGKLLIVQDPSRVVLATAPVFAPDAAGVRVADFAVQNNAVAAINGGGFADENGVGLGGQPLGLVIKGGELLYGGGSNEYSVVGFDSENRLVVGTLTTKQCMERGIRDAVSFGPALIVNGQPQQATGSGGGLNPRTALGQRADGAVLMLVIDGRQAHSIGATFQDCIDVLMEYGAVNAGNLDGGSSSILWYDGEIRNICSSLYGPRPLPTAFIVL